MAIAELNASNEVKSPFASPRADLGRRARATDTVIIAVGIIAGLYFGRDVLVPFTLAVLLSFVLAPLVDALTRMKAGKVPSVLLAVALAFAILIGLGALIGKQVAVLSANLPQYQLVIGKKLATLRSSDLGKDMVEKAKDALEGLNNKLSSPAPAGPEPVAKAPVNPAPAPAPVPVEVHQPPPGPVQIVESVLSALLPPLATAGIVVIFVIFILLQRDDLRDRFIGLTGTHDLHRTTAGLNEAASRLSGYFLALTGINAAFGLCIGIGLAVIGVPNPILWGIVGAILRFVPYLGALIAAAFPLALAAAVDPGWIMVVETALLFIVVETIIGQVVEPQLFGHTTGMSPLAIIVAAMFWTLIWGPPGLLLSTPLTACLVVLGRHVEYLNFIELLLGDKPALSPVQSFYQRILSSDPDEVTFQAETLLKESTLLDYYEDVAMPALALAQADVSREVLNSDRLAAACASVERVVEDLSDHVDPETQPAPEIAEPLVAPAVVDDEIVENPLKALCLAGRTMLDQAGCAILSQLLQRKKISSSFAGPDSLTTRGIFALDATGVDAIYILYFDHRSMAPVRYSVRRLRRKFPSIPVVVCHWGDTDARATSEATGADATVSTLRAALEFLDAGTFSAEADLADSDRTTQPAKVAQIG
jgi:predicted PurR-regulated permease PerM